MLSCDVKPSTAFLFPRCALQDFLSSCKATSHGRHVSCCQVFPEPASVCFLGLGFTCASSGEDSNERCLSWAWALPAGLGLCLLCPSLLQTPLAWPSPPSCQWVLPVLVFPACHLLHSSSVTVGCLQSTTKHIIWACFISGFWPLASP